MDITVRHSDFLEVRYIEPATNHGNNGDSFQFTISTPGGQECLLNGEPVEQFTFTIVGGIELGEFMAAMDIIKKL